MCFIFILSTGAHSRTKESPSSKSDNTEVAVSFDEPVQVETLSSIAKSKVCYHFSIYRSRARNTNKSQNVLNFLFLFYLESSSNSSEASTSKPSSTSLSTTSQWD